MRAGIRVNVGCGQSPTPGWSNIDNSLTVRLARSPLAFLLRSKRDYVERARRDNIAYGTARKLPFADGAVEVVYSSHMLEHLDRREAREFLLEAKRVLAPGGRIRIVVPDLAKAVENYTDSGDGDAFMLAIHMHNDRPVGTRQTLGHAIAGFREHRWMYDARSLSALLTELGYREVASFPAGETGIADPGALDLRERADESLYVEGVA